MKTMRSIWIFALSALLLVLAAGCQAKPTATPKAEAVVTAEAVTTSASTSASTSAPEIPAATALGGTPQPVSTESSLATPAPAPDEIDALLKLRSVRISLVVDREGDGSRELVAEIDSAGNMRIVNTSTGVENNLPEEMYVNMTAVQHELRVVDGQAYRQDGEGDRWGPAPELEDYLARSLRGSEGPGLWIRLMAGGTRASRGQEALGPYSADHFFLSGDIDGKTVSGDIWIDAASGALVGANLEVPGVLYTHSDGGVHYPVVIKLNVVPAEIEPVKLP